MQEPNRTLLIINRAYFSDFRFMYNVRVFSSFLKLANGRAYRPVHSGSEAPVRVQHVVNRQLFHSNHQ